MLGPIWDESRKSFRILDEMGRGEEGASTKNPWAKVIYTRRFGLRQTL